MKKILIAAIISLSTTISLADTFNCTNDNYESISDTNDLKTKALIDLLVFGIIGGLLVLIKKE